MSLSPEEKNAIQQIEGSLGFKVMEHLIATKVAALDTVADLDARSIDRVGIEALARKKALHVLKGFLNDLGFLKSPLPTDPVSRTYE